MTSGKSVLADSINDIFQLLQGTITYQISLIFSVSNYFHEKFVHTPPPLCILGPPHFVIRK